VIAIFRRAGLQPVFFGETLIGAKMPNLTYMLVFENMAARSTMRRQSTGEKFSANGKSESVLASGACSASRAR